MRPSEAEVAEYAHRLDSIEQVKQDTQADVIDIGTNQRTTPPSPDLVDSISTQQNQARFGSYAKHGSGDSKEFKLKNNLIELTFSNKGGRITQAVLSNYKKLYKNEEREEVKIPLLLLEDEKNKFEYWLPLNQVPSGKLNTADLYFDVEQSSDEVKFKVTGTDGSYFEQSYVLKPNSYIVDYSISFNGLDTRDNSFKLLWENYLDKIEINTDFEKYYSTLYFKEVEEDVDYCNCRSDAVEELQSKSIKWVSASNQFFNTALIAEHHFQNTRLETVMLDTDTGDDLKKLVTDIGIPFSGTPGGETVNMQMYIGPNDFQLLRSLDQTMEDIIPFGRSIFGSINRWIIRPIFDFLSGFVGSMGIVILILTLIVKLALYPLTYKMLHSQTKMSVLKPEMASLKEKHKDEPQKAQMETMKIYREFGVNPLGGCMPMVLQMPIWFALYRFFPASIEFRQASFLWATDLSSYDVFFNLPWDIPFYGAHVSLFTLLWAGTTLIYTYYNSKIMDMNAINPMMKYMQYFMPLMFLFFFNNYASGLTCYLMFSNIINIGQTLGTKNLLFNEERIKEELYAKKKKPKKKSKFQARLEQAMKDQQNAKSKKTKR